MRDRSPHNKLLITAISIGFLVIAVMMIMIDNVSDANQQLATSTKEYVKNGTIHNADTLRGIFYGGRMSLDSIGNLYGELEQKAEDVTAEDLENLAQAVWFDRLIFVDLKGKGLDEEGHSYDFTDSPNFKDAIEGNAGVGSAYVPNDHSVNQLCFYAPVKSGEQVIGALLGYFDDSSLESLLQTQYFGYTSHVFLCNEEGTIIASTVEDLNTTSLETYFSKEHALEDATSKELFQHMNDSDAYGFQFHTEDGESQAYMVGIKDCNLTLVQMFPVQAIEELRGSTNVSRTKLVVSLISLFVLYIIVLILLYHYRQQKIEQENQSITHMIGAITKMFDRFMLVDLEKDQYEYIVDNPAAALPGMAAKGAYHDIVDHVFCYCYQSGEEKESMDRHCTKEALQQAFAEGQETLMFEYSEEFPGTEFRWTNLAVLCMERKHGTATKVLLASQDETSIKMDEIQSKDALREAYEAADSASRAKSDFLSKMSHDIRTPMNAIIGMTAVAASHIEEPARLEDCLKKITVSSRHLLALINEVLDMSRIESSRLTLAEEEFDLSDLLETTLDLMRPSMVQKNLDFSVLISEMQHEKVIGDSLYVQKIFTNILSNAVKYTPEGGKITVHIEEKPARFVRTGCFQFVFEDTGIGMSEAFLPHIFEPFERAKDSRIDKIQGTGLGMSIVKNVVQMMGGDIKVESRLNEGSRFTVTILLKLQDEEEKKEQCLADLNVLVADDEEVACVTVCNMLETLGMNGEWVLSGADAVRRVVEEKDGSGAFQAVILDWKMPGMDGIEAAKQIRAKVGAEVPVIVISAYDWSDVEQEARQAGVDAFISKPIFKSKLSATLKRLFDEYSEEEQSILDEYQKKRYESKRVLLVEDNAINMEISKELLSMTGIMVETAENGQEAVEKVLQSPLYYYDIIFLDIQMPVMNGYEACIAIRAQEREDLKKVPIIAVTANAFAEDIMDAVNAGMNQHLSKPVDLKQLQAVLEHWL